MKSKTNISDNILQEVLPNGTAFEMIFVEGGNFMMGSEEESYWGEYPIHEVKLDDFFIGKFPVIQGLLLEVMNDNPSFFKGSTRPAEMMFWEDTQVFLQRLNELTGEVYRLPTEAEWEYAARGGRYSQKYKYAGSNKIREVGWYWENSHRETKAVGLKYPNELGLYDMSGNIREWCQDWYGGTYYEECYNQGVIDNPQGPAEGTSRVLRGGSWNTASRYCRCSSRASGPGDPSYGIGFRLVLPSQAVEKPKKRKANSYC